MANFMTYQKIQITNLQKRMEDTETLLDVQQLVYQVGGEYLSKLIKRFNKSKQYIRHEKGWLEIDPISACETIMHDDLHYFAEILAKLRDRAVSLSDADEDIPF